MNMVISRRKRLPGYRLTVWLNDGRKLFVFGIDRGSLIGLMERHDVGGLLWAGYTVAHGVDLE